MEGSRSRRDGCVVRDERQGRHAWMRKRRLRGAKAGANADGLRGEGEEGKRQGVNVLSVNVLIVVSYLTGRSKDVNKYEIEP